MGFQGLAVDNDVKFVHIISAIHIQKHLSFTRLILRQKKPLTKDYEQVGWETCKALKIAFKNNKSPKWLTKYNPQLTKIHIYNMMQWTFPWDWQQLKEGREMERV